MKLNSAEKIVLSVTDPEAVVTFDKEGVYRPLYSAATANGGVGECGGESHRQLRYFSGRGLRRVRAQVALTVLVQNLLTVSAPKSE